MGSNGDRRARRAAPVRATKRETMTLESGIEGREWAARGFLLRRFLPGRGGGEAVGLPVWRGPLLPLAVAGALAAVITVIGVRGSDFPAHVYQATSTRRHGFLAWNGNWYGGIPTMGYSVLSPVLGALVGPVGLVLAAGLIATVLFDRLTVDVFGPAARIASVWFATATATNLLVGRVPFALGMALGLASLLALRRSHPVVAVLLAVPCALSSPLAGLFLALIVVAWATDDRSRYLTAVGVVAAAVGPTLVIAVMFPTTGTFPYRAGALVRDIAIAGVVAVAAGRRHRVVRRFALGFMVVAVVTYLVHSPVGGNLSRLPQFAAGPVLACLWWPRRRVLLALAAVPLVLWQWVPAFHGAAVVGRADYTQEAYYEPVVDYVTSRPGVRGRVEIPFTRSHWEAAYVARDVPLARGWERQIDIAYNPVFYDSTLDATTYRAWLADNAVEYVALPDAPLDPSSIDEGALIAAGLPYLSEVRRDEHWRIFRFTGYRGMVDGPGDLVELGPDSFRLRARRAGTYLVRVNHSPHWAVEGPGCVRSAPDGWTEIVVPHAGEYQVVQSLGGTPCAH